MKGFLNSDHPAIRYLRDQRIGIGEIFAILAIAIPTTSIILMFVLQKWWVTIIITYERREVYLHLVFLHDMI